MRAKAEATSSNWYPRYDSGRTHPYHPTAPAYFYRKRGCYTIRANINLNKHFPVALLFVEPFKDRKSSIRFRGKRGSAYVDRAYPHDVRGSGPRPVDGVVSAAIGPALSIGAW
jgi:hypothetical protein